MRTDSASLRPEVLSSDTASLTRKSAGADISSARNVGSAHLTGKRPVTPVCRSREGLGRLLGGRVRISRLSRRGRRPWLTEDSTPPRVNGLAGAPRWEDIMTGTKRSDACRLEFAQPEAMRCRKKRSDALSVGNKQAALRRQRGVVRRCDWLRRPSDDYIARFKAMGNSVRNAQTRSMCSR